VSAVGSRVRSRTFGDIDNRGTQQDTPSVEKYVGNMRNEETERKRLAV